MDSLPTETIANIVRFIPLDEKHIVKRVNRKWQDAASFTIKHQRTLELNFEDEDEVTTRVNRAVQQGAVPEVIGVKHLKIRYPAEAEEWKTVLAVLLKVAPSVTSMDIINDSEYENWIVKVFDQNVFPELLSLRIGWIPEPAAPTVLAVCPKLTSINVHQKDLFAALPDRLTEMEIELSYDEHHLKRHHLSPFKRLTRLSVRDTVFGSHKFKSLFTGFSHLQELLVSQTQFCINDQKIRDLAQAYPNLRKLVLDNLDRPRFTHRDKSQCSLTASSIDYLNQMHSLTFLRLGSPQWDVDPAEWNRLRILKAGNQQMLVSLVKGKHGNFNGTLQWSQDQHFNLEGDLAKPDLWSLFANVIHINKLTLKMTGKGYVTESAALVLCYKYQDRMQELDLTGIKLTDDFLHIVCSMRVRKLVVDDCDCKFTAPSLLKFLKKKVDDGSLQELHLVIDQFQFKRKDEETFIGLLKRLPKCQFVIKKDWPDKLNASCRITNFERCEVVDWEVGQGTKTLVTEDNSSGSDSDEEEKIPVPGTKYSYRSMSLDLDNMLEQYTNVTCVNFGKYADRLPITGLLRNQQLKHLTFAGYLDDNVMMALSGMPHLEKLILTSKDPFTEKTAAGVMMLLIGPSSRTLTLIRCRLSLCAFTGKVAKKMLYDKVAAINVSRKEGRRLVLDIEDKRKTTFSSDTKADDENSLKAVLDSGSESDSDYSE